MLKSKHLICVTAALTAMVFAQGCASKKKTEPPATAAQAGAATPAAPKPDAKAAPAPSIKSAGKTECTLGGDKRVIEVIETASSGCEVMYTKFGTVEKVGSSANGKAHCEALSAKIQANLETAGFKCP